MYLKIFLKNCTGIWRFKCQSLYKTYFIPGLLTSLWASVYLLNKNVADFQSSFQLKDRCHYLSQSEEGDSNYNILLPKNKMLAIIRKNRNITEIIFQIL